MPLSTKFPIVEGREETYICCLGTKWYLGKVLKIISHQHQLRFFSTKLQRCAISIEIYNTKSFSYFLLQGIEKRKESMQDERNPGSKRFLIHCKKGVFLHEKYLQKLLKLTFFCMWFLMDFGFEFLGFRRVQELDLRPKILCPYSRFFGFATFLGPNWV